MLFLREMDVVVLKIIVTPVLVGVASLVGRRWGPSVGGWLVGLPFTSAPITFFVALDHGLSFAAAVAAGTLAGTVSQAGFAAIYARRASHAAWPGTLLAGCLGFAAITAILQHLTVPLAVLVPTTALVLVVALHLIPPRQTVTPAAHVPHWDLPVRMVVATVFVLLLTGLASALGPRLTGLLAPFPLYGTVLAVFAQRLQGPIAAVEVLRGLLFGLFAFATFFLILSTLLVPAGLPLAFALALVGALAVQALTLLLLRRRSCARRSGLDTRSEQRPSTAP